MKASILYKLAFQVTEYYDRAAAVVQEPAIKSSVPTYWPIFLQARSTMYRAIAYYQRSLLALAEDKYGQQVGWLTAANGFLEDPVLQKKLKSQGPGLQQQFAEKQELISNAFRTAHRDNSKIYHELVPRELPTLEMKSMVQPLPFKPSEAPLDQDPFRGLVSKVAEQYSATFQGQMTEIVNRLSSDVEESDQVAKM